MPERTTRKLSGEYKRKRKKKKQNGKGNGDDYGDKKRNNGERDKDRN